MLSLPSPASRGLAGIKFRAAFPPPVPLTPACKKLALELPWWSSVWDSVLPLQRMWVHSLVGELDLANHELWPKKGNIVLNELSQTQ